MPADDGEGEPDAQRVETRADALFAFEYASNTGHQNLLSVCWRSYRSRNRARANRSRSQVVKSITAGKCQRNVNAVAGTNSACSEDITGLSRSRIRIGAGRAPVRTAVERVNTSAKTIC